VKEKSLMRIRNALAIGMLIELAFLAIANIAENGLPPPFTAAAVILATITVVAHIIARDAQDAADVMADEERESPLPGPRVFDPNPESVYMPNRKDGDK